MVRLLAALPVLVAVVFGAFLLWGLNPNRDPSSIPSVLISQPVPQFDLPAVEGMDVFASWCVPCRAEHAVLTRLVRDENVRLFGINYKDKPEDARAWLEELGNPYEKIGSDLEGRAGIEWGLSGVPETFIVGGDGTVLFRYVGPIVGEEPQAQFRAALRQAQTRAEVGS
jgi:cytochrome c biogenesis protein CcmG/thiol:disulfide interchange protein DsbE